MKRVLSEMLSAEEPLPPEEEPLPPEEEPADPVPTDGRFWSDDFEQQSTGNHVPGWVDTAAGNSMNEDDMLFGVSDLGGNRVLGTTSTETNIHSHYITPESVAWSAYEYRGRMLVTDRNKDDPPIAMDRDPPVPSPVGTRRLSPWIMSIRSSSMPSSAATRSQIQPSTEPGPKSSIAV